MLAFNSFLYRTHVILLPPKTKKDLLLGGSPYIYRVGCQAKRLSMSSSVMMENTFLPSGV